MKFYLFLSIAVLMVVAPCASADKTDKKDPYQHPHTSHAAQEPQRKSHATAAGTSQLPKSNTNVELAKLEKQTARIQSAETKKIPKQKPVAGNKPPTQTRGGNSSMNFSYHPPKEHTTTAASKTVPRGSTRR